MPFRRALSLIAAALNLPFGYTLATWSSATIASYYFGVPNPLEVFAYLAGGITAYLVLAFVSARFLGPVTPVRMRKATLINLFSAVAAAAVSVVVQVIHAPLLGFFFAGFTSTLTYMLALALLLWLTSWQKVAKVINGRSRQTPEAALGRQP